MFDEGVLSFVRAQIEHPERTYAIPTRGPLYRVLTSTESTPVLRMIAVEQALVEAYQAGYNAAHSGPENTP